VCVSHPGRSLFRLDLLRPRLRHRRRRPRGLRRARWVVYHDPRLVITENTAVQAFGEGGNGYRKTRSGEPQLGSPNTLKSRPFRFQAIVIAFHGISGQAGGDAQRHFKEQLTVAEVGPGENRVPVPGVDLVQSKSGGRGNDPKKDEFVLAVKNG